MHKFNAEIKMIGVNPYVFVPDKILENIFIQSGRDKGHIPICGTINGKVYRQTLVKFKGEWRFYINTSMLKHSPKRIGEMVELTIKYDNEDRTIQPHPKLVKALEKNKNAKRVFENLSPSRRHEIVRYIYNLKTETSVEKNITKAINFLTGKERFAGRDKP